jgi:abortive infection bacteriophage resistance protein
LLKIENQIKATIAYKFSEKYGHDNYLKLVNFAPHNNHNGRLKDIMSVISTFQKAVAYQSGQHNAVTHYVTEYGYVPLWVLVNVLTFGNISKFYGVLKHQDRQSIAKQFGIADNVFLSYLKLMSLFRNICAHDERLYNTKTNIEIVSSTYHAGLNIPKDPNGKCVCGIKDLFALLICLKAFLPDRKRGEFSETIRQIDNEIEKLQSKIHTIDISEVLSSMGFPDNWKQL